MELVHGGGAEGRRVGTAVAPQTPVLRWGSQQCCWFRSAPALRFSLYWCKLRRCRGSLISQTPRRQPGKGCPIFGVFSSSFLRAQPTHLSIRKTSTGSLNQIQSHRGSRALPHHNLVALFAPLFQRSSRAKTGSGQSPIRAGETCHVLRKNGWDQSVPIGCGGWLHR